MKHSVGRPHRPSIINRLLDTSRRTLVLVCVVTFGLVTVLGALFPAKSSADPGQVTVTDAITFSGTAPTQDSMILVANNKDATGNYPMAELTDNNPSVSGNTATFSFTFTAVYDYPTVTSSNSSPAPSQTYQPIPAGQYTLSSFGTSKSQTITVASDGTGSANMSGPYSPFSLSNLKGSNLGGLQAYSQACSANPSSQYCPGAGTNTNNTQTTCESSSGALAWIMCETMKYLANGIDAIYQSVILPMLTSPGIAPDTSTGKQLFDAWSRFRVYADLFLVIAVLVVVFAGAIGGE